ncbi:VOC family protein [Sinorhizobium terangae]|uniref:Glyoxalase/bleomycin resistance/extradiol dioxygenase family protein n=1 Tax=Sinorhizobium terangae TaxID=110322 RepID=A0A6N7L8V2_SINTE|nr:VOC family protein [Sinorhizobium terangae]MBB4186751.1 lactoylglutathione lyase [Sinorhizobium terangae]MQX13730.1 glyoxalase/bleomycin resistance/extradiol dioxygenase family protein [Sinorhizobium terangae]WFU47417.1 VOC family protein [Sinorhizobium terangae]
MNIAHVALWTKDIDRIAAFWTDFFDASVGEIYESRRRPGFRSRFLTLGSGPSIEVMEGPWLAPHDEATVERVGYAHIALSLGSGEKVDDMAERAGKKGILVSGVRWTGDGFYEAVIRDPDGNLIEITI